MDEESLGPQASPQRGLPGAIQGGPFPQGSPAWIAFQKAFFRCIGEWMFCRWNQVNDPDWPDKIGCQIGELDWMAEAWRLAKERKEDHAGRNHRKSPL